VQRPEQGQIHAAGGRQRAGEPRGADTAEGARRRPRLAALEAAWAMVRDGRPGAARTLHGCVLRLRRDSVMIAREPAAARTGEGPLWDGRWRLKQTAEGAPGPLGAEGLAALRAARRDGRWTAPRGWRDAPRAARAATPALWRNGALVAAPLAAYGVGLEAVLADDWPHEPR
jgi:tRNA(Ile)-lysidine synthase